MKTKHIIMACFALCGLWACDERVPDLYSAPDGIYFNNRTANNVLLDSTTVTFVYEPDETEVLDVPVVVQSVGRQSDTGRPVALRVWSDNAVEGVDYELPTPAVMPAGASSFSFVVRLLKTDALLTEQKTIHLELSANEYFETFLAQEATGSSGQPYTEMLKYRIDYSNYYSTPPAGWLSEYVGEFSERKLRLLWKLFDDVVPREDYNVAGAIPFNRWIYMQREVDNYLFTQANILLGFEAGEVDPDALVNPAAPEDEWQLLDFTPVAVED